MCCYARRHYWTLKWPGRQVPSFSIEPAINLYGESRLPRDVDNCGTALTYKVCPASTILTTGLNCAIIEKVSVPLGTDLGSCRWETALLNDGNGIEQDAVFALGDFQGERSGRQGPTHDRIVVIVAVSLVPAPST